MKAASGRLFAEVRSFSQYAILFAIIMSLIFHRLISQTDLNWQVAVSIVALLIGIPHGAVDHLITIPRANRARFVAFILIYIAIAVIAILALLRWNVLGFQLVIWMSAIHFGFGDASFIAQHDELISRQRSHFALKILYAIPAGTLPVVIPLVQNQSTNALQRINPALIHWAGSYAGMLKTTVVTLAILSICVLGMYRKFREALDLVLLMALALVAPPLVAFAFYFGCWHAMRHTARLTLILPRAIAAATEGRILTSFFRAVIPGLPALAGTGVIATSLAFFDHQGINSSLLWSLLVVVWALTVPHMMATSTLDVKALTAD
jgi:Brp/Blh family beta-carotene 15,15'-monooxygenase